MIKLIKLEYKKNNIKKYIIITLILSGVLLLFCFAMTYLGIARDSDTGVVDAVEGANTVESHVDLLTTISFMILSSAMQSTFIVDAYKNKTMDLMFQYPIGRKKILISKILAVLIFGFSALVLCKLIIYVALYIGSFFMTPDFLVDGIRLLSPAFYFRIILQSLSTICLSIIALYIGLLCKSTKVPVITSFLLILLSQGNIGQFTLANSKVFPVVLIAVSIFCAFLCVVKIETKDVGGGKDT
ncbi:MAG: ABC transporter permease [Lachnospiraceae bacterium]